MGLEQRNLFRRWRSCQRNAGWRRVVTALLEDVRAEMRREEEEEVARRKSATRPSASMRATPSGTARRSGMGLEAAAMAGRNEEWRRRGGRGNEDDASAAVAAWVKLFWGQRNGGRPRETAAAPRFLAFLALRRGTHGAGALFIVFFVWKNPNYYRK